MNLSSVCLRNDHEVLTITSMNGINISINVPWSVIISNYTLHLTRGLIAGDFPQQFHPLLSFVYMYHSIIPSHINLSHVPLHSHLRIIIQHAFLHPVILWLGMSHPTQLVPLLLQHPTLRQFPFFLSALHSALSLNNILVMIYNM